MPIPRSAGAGEAIRLHKVASYAAVVAAGFSVGAATWAGSIETAVLERPWPNEHVRTLEVGHHEVQWRQAASRKDGIFAGVRFLAPRERVEVWRLATDYTDIGAMTPGVTAVRFLERTPTRQVIQVDVQVLWKKLQLTFETEQEPPESIRFQLNAPILGEYRGLCTFQERAAAQTTDVELSTWLKPARPVPMRLLLIVERMTLLQGAKSFLKSCEASRPASQPPAS